MKLRNKKTGEIIDLSVGFIKDTYNGKFIQIRSEAISYKEGYLYGSLAELNEYWEDYTPAEPLIKDPKIRKAVRAWAECCCIPLVKHYLSNGLSCFICNDEEDNEYCLDFTFCINNLEAEHIYTITELCGEEKE